MPHTLPLRTDWPLAETAFQLGVDEAELRHALGRGSLKAHVWVPLMSVFQIRSAIEPPQLCHWEGYTPISRHYCQRLFRQGKIRLRDFPGELAGQRLVLPYSAEDLVVTVTDLVILAADRSEWEKRWTAYKQRMVQKSTASPKIETIPSFRRVRIGNEEHHFGSVQAAALRLLFQAAKNGEPWLNGKKLLHDAGSQSYTLSNLFKRKPVWRKLIHSDGRGYYRMQERILRSLTQTSA
ncbi:hypothetical protein HNR46_003964 [Haloferula luteola]|uniref:Uncharacterized protein n=1 Tax=Haloferula luteola TaxID=595692 RepID=A0A840V7K8_9BACT|nr:hypothetical protein [Haloferula luteola]MBB5353703.1 hypothetical protein [Haloferula luteola]